MKISEKMMRITAIALLFCLAHATAGAQKSYLPGCFHMGIHTGIDVGAAAPWPLSKAIGGGDKMNATPHLSPAAGIWAEQKFNHHWSAVVEATYKTVALDAELITLKNGQKFKDDDGLNVTFYGRASTSMSFSMLEVPLYLKYKFNERNRVFVGGYYAWVFKSRFEAMAMDGRLENPEDPDDIVIVYPRDPVDQSFNENLDKWDAGWLVGYERRIHKRVNVAGRFSMGVKDIFKKGENYLDYSMWNLRGTLTLTYQIF